MVEPRTQDEPSFQEFIFTSYACKDYSRAYFNHVDQKHGTTNYPVENQQIWKIYGFSGDFDHVAPRIKYNVEEGASYEYMYSLCRDASARDQIKLVPFHLESEIENCKWLFKRYTDDSGQEYWTAQPKTDLNQYLAIKTGSIQFELQNLGGGPLQPEHKILLVPVPTFKAWNCKYIQDSVEKVPNGQVFAVDETIENGSDWVQSNSIEYSEELTTTHSMTYTQEDTITVDSSVLIGIPQLGAQGEITFSGSTTWGEMTTDGITETKKVTGIVPINAKPHTVCHCFAVFQKFLVNIKVEMTYEYDNPKFNIIVHGLYKGALVSSLVTTYDEKPFP